MTRQGPGPELDNYSTNLSPEVGPSSFMYVDVYLKLLKLTLKIFLVIFLHQSLSDLQKVSLNVVKSSGRGTMKVFLDKLILSKLFLGKSNQIV